MTRAQSAQVQKTSSRNFSSLHFRSSVSLGARVPKLCPYGDGNTNGCVLQAWTQFSTLVHRLALQSYLRFAEEIVRSAVERANEEKLPYPPTPPYRGYRSSGGGMAMNAL